MNGTPSAESSPQARGWSRRACRGLLRLFGWRAVLVPLPGPKGVIMVYPHTSNWDFIVGILYRHGVGLPANWMGKDSLFRGSVGALFRRLGGIPINRRERQGVVAALIDVFRERDVIWLVIAPEGTRSRVDRLKSGFYQLALGANVPCGLGYIDYATRTIGIDTYVQFSGDEDADLRRLREFYSTKKGRRSELAGTIAFR